jgi:type III restriction enzyme
MTAEVINRCKRLFIVDGIKYQRLGGGYYFAQELFEQEELTGYLRNMLTETKKSVYEQVVYGSGTERTFAEELEKNNAVNVYAKLPGWFSVPTPLGGYNPDWAVLVQEDDQERLYLVVETKGTLFADALRNQEAAKIKCGEAHFKSLALGENPAKFIKAAKLDDVFAVIQ